MVRDEMTEVNGRVLQAPSILYGGRVSDSKVTFSQFSLVVSVLVCLSFVWSTVLNELNCSIVMLVLLLVFGSGVFLGIILEFCLIIICFFGFE
jgi:hypothetical protein